ncbi:MAG: aminotransferase class I/II-fold pyridoxal phosphate-dependent enzyme [Woeseiaceae bacterium]
MKKIQSHKDLAIHGAAPAFDEKLHVGRPNIGSRDEFLKLVGEILDRRWLTNNGPVVQEFEQRVADYHEVRHCVAMCNGTVALEIAIRATGMKDEVIIPSYTFIATAHALHWQDIKPVFADIDPATHNLDPKSVRRMITPRTTGILGVHLWGRSAPTEALQAIADEHGLSLIFDAAHAFACSSSGTMIGSFGNCEVLSFHATKFFNTFEGGAVLTNNDELAETMRLMRNFGFAGLDNVIHPGTNGKMTEICAAMGLVNLDAIDAVIDANRRNYRTYQDEFSRLPGINLLEFDDADRQNYQYVVIEIGDEYGCGRDEIVEALHAENIIARRYFWPGCHNMSPYRDLYPGAGEHLPHTQNVADSVMVLPTGTTMDAEKVRSVMSIIATLRTGSG